MKPGPYWLLKALLSFVTAMSIDFCAVVVAVLELFAATESVSGKVTETVAVSVMVVPDAVVGSTVTTKTKFDVVVLALMKTPELVVQVTAPVPPTAGVVQVQPDGGVMETNVVLVGTDCEKVTVWVVPVLLRFERLCVYVRCEPELTGSAETEFVVTSRSIAQVT